MMISTGSKNTNDERARNGILRINTRSESEGRVLSEKLAALQQSHSEQEDLVNRLQERMATLQNNLTDNEVNIAFIIIVVIRLDINDILSQKVKSYAESSIWLPRRALLP